MNSTLAPRRAAAIGGTAALILSVVGVTTAEANPTHRPERIVMDYVEEYEEPELAAACGIEAVEVVEHGTFTLALLPKGPKTTITELGTLTNPATGDTVQTTQHSVQSEVATERLREDGLLEVTSTVAVRGLGTQYRAPGIGAFTQAGRFEAVLTIVLDVSGDEPTEVDFDADIVSSAGSILDDFSDSQLALLCQGLGGSDQA